MVDGGRWSGAHFALRPSRSLALWLPTRWQSCETNAAAPVANDGSHLLYQRAEHARCDLDALRRRARPLDGTRALRSEKEAAAARPPPRPLPRAARLGAPLAPLAARAWATRRCLTLALPAPMR